DHEFANDVRGEDDDYDNEIQTIHFYVATSIMHNLHTKKGATIHQLRLEEGARRVAAELGKCTSTEQQEVVCGILDTTDAHDMILET
ncbi:hypothetical protein Tco_1034784, partial [Tanacetum coccineum]